MQVLSPADLGIGRLFEVIREAVIVADAESRRIVLWNPAAEKLFGYRAAEAVGLPLEVLVPDDLKARFRAGFVRYGATGRGRLIEAGRPLEVPAVRKDGAECTIELTLCPIGDAPIGGLFVLALVRDVTERRMEEQTARRLAAIVESSEDAIIGKTLDGIVTSWNSGAEQLFGYAAQEMVGQSVARLVPPDRLDELSGLLARLRRGERIEQYETKRLCKDGRLIDVSSTVSPLRDAAGRLVGAAVITRDITEHKQSEMRLRASEERYRLATRATRDVIWDLNLATGEFAGSEVFRQVFGYAPDEALETVEGAHRWWLAHVHPDDCERVHADYQAALQGAGEGWETEYRFRRADGTYAHVLDRGYIARDEQGRATRMLGALQDITERKRVEEERARLYKALAEREQQLQDLVGRLILAQEEERRRVAYALHDGLAQTAAGVHMHLRAFARRNRERMPERREELDQALELSQRVVREARGVVAELRPTALDDLGLEAALEAEVEELRKQGWQVDLEADLGSERLAPAVETALFRVAQEALRNVRKHAGAERARVALRRTRRRVRLEVQDWGRGFRPGAEQPVAGPGERVGLSGIRERIALLGGRCEVRSRPGAGTRIVAEVPLGAPGRG